MKNIFTTISSLLVLSLLTMSTSLYAKTVTSKFKIEGLISEASPKTLKSALESTLKVKVVNLNLNKTDSGWPEMSIEYDSASVSDEAIEKLIASTEDPAGHKYKVHKGKLQPNAPLTKEEQEIATVLGPKEDNFPKLTNPVAASAESVGRGKALYDENCARCHGMNGSGYGPAVHAFTTWPRQLWVWSSVGASADSYLFGFITNGKSDMPPWGVIFSENQRWDLVNYIKTLKPPVKK